jgi:hypothetical protein
MSPSAPAQTTHLSGMVTDPAGARVAQAQVVVDQKDRGFRRSTMTNETGLFSIPLLPPATYSITVRAAGFQTIVREAVAVSADQPVRIDFALTIGEATETVNVNGVPPLINMEDGAVATTLDSTLVQGLPINGRSFQALLTVVPGAVPTTNNQVGAFNVNGQRSTANAFTVDGASVNVASPFQVSPVFSFGAGNVLGTTPSGSTQSVPRWRSFRRSRCRPRATTGGSEGSPAHR